MSILYDMGSPIAGWVCPTGKGLGGSYLIDSEAWYVFNSHLSVGWKQIRYWIFLHMLKTCLCEGRLEKRGVRGGV